jgi:hypothetical protein
LAIVDLPAPERPVNQSTLRTLALLRRLGLARDVDGLPVDVGGAAQGEVQKAGGDGGVADLVDQDEAAEIVIFS